jgi:hypothetical protein
VADPLARRLGAVLRRYVPAEVQRELLRALACEMADAAADALAEDRPRRVGQRPPAGHVANDVNLEAVSPEAQALADTALRRRGLL